jgi:hypothetical protein
MITLSPLASGLKVVGPNSTFVVFPKDTSAATDNTIVLLSIPEEVPSKNVISWPGEYNISNVTLRGIAHKEGQQVSFMAIMDDTKVAFLSTPLVDWSSDQIESAGDIDVLVMPIGDQRTTQKLIDEFDPRVLVLVPGSDGDPQDPTFKALGAKDDSIMSELKLKGSLPQEGRQVVILAK